MVLLCHIMHVRNTHMYLYPAHTMTVHTSPLGLQEGPHLLGEVPLGARLQQGRSGRAGKHSAAHGLRVRARPGGGVPAGEGSERDHQELQRLCLPGRVCGPGTKVSLVTYSTERDDEDTTKQWSKWRPLPENYWPVPNII